MWFAGATQSCQNIEAPIFKITERIASSDIEMAGDSSNAAKDSQGREVEIWPLALPGRYEAVYFIPLKRIRIALHKK
jgi:hypothetical protein